jgi:hypothetical protein
MVGFGCIIGCIITGCIEDDGRRKTERTFFKSCGGQSQLKTEKRVKRVGKYILSKKQKNRRGGEEKSKEN